MNKKQLSKLRRLPATSTMVVRAKMPGIKERRYTCRLNKYKYKYMARCQYLDGILKLSICKTKEIRKGDTEPKWDVFLSPKDKTYITRERQKDGTYKWRTARIDNLEWEWEGEGADEKYYINPEGKAAIKAILETKNSGVEGAIEWQEKVRTEKVEREEKRKTDRWDAAMKDVPESYPAGFEKYWKTEAFNDHYIFYKGADAKTGYCTGCLQEVPLNKKPKHNEWNKCPKCGKKIVYESRSKKKNPIWSYGTATLLQRYRDGIVKRTFSCTRIDTGENMGQPKLIIREVQRVLLTDDGVETYCWEDYRIKGQRWRKQDTSYYEERYANLYQRNLSALLKNTRTTYNIAIKHGYIGDPVFFMKMEKRNPLIEKVFKAGLYRIGNDLIRNDYWYQELVDEEEPELIKALYIDKARLARLKRMNGGRYELLWLQDEKKNNTIYKDEDVQTLASALVDGADSRIFQYVSVAKAANYLRKQQTIRDRNLVDIASEWKDYLSMLEKRNADMSNGMLLRPKDLTLAHNELVIQNDMLNKGKEIEEKKKTFKNAEKLMKSGALKKYEYQNEKYCILSPTGIKDIYNEGMTLKHCIHTCDIYFQRIDIQETYLLFLRRTEKPDTPWYTLEVEPGGNIRQKKSVLNEAYSDLEDAMPFLKEWQQWVKKNLSKEDAALAEKSDKARKKNYGQLRREKKLIWHGRLQGTMLVDALENDFMEV